MKAIFTTALALTAALGSLSSLAAKEPQVLIVTAKDTFKGYMIAADETAFLWRETPKDLTKRKQSLRTATVYFVQPTEFTEAMELFKSRNYKDAAPKFAACAEEYKNVDKVKGNYSTLAKFYELDCARRLEDLETLAGLFETFKPEPLLHEYHKLQYEVYGVFWEAVRTKGWSRLDAIARDEKWRNRKVPGNIRAQISYCHGLALEGANMPIKALNAYNNAFVADFAASEEISRKAATNCLRILLSHEDVKLAMSLYTTEDYSNDSNGAMLIKEGTAILKLWDKVLGSGEKVPAEYKEFLKFPPKK